MLLTLALGLTVSLQISSAQTQTPPLPKFEDYPVQEASPSTLHPPIILKPEHRRYRTRIREGVAKGWGVWVNGEWGNEQHGPGPNFAGHYIVIIWGCGTGCIMMAMCDGKSGTVYNPPISTGGLALPMLVFPNTVGGAPQMEYRKDSRLMIIKATPHFDRPESLPYTFYYLWQDTHWKLLRRVRLYE